MLQDPDGRTCRVKKSGKWKGDLERGEWRIGTGKWRWGGGLDIGEWGLENEDWRVESWGWKVEFGC